MSSTTEEFDMRFHAIKKLLVLFVYFPYILIEVIITLLVQNVVFNSVL